MTSPILNANNLDQHSLFSIAIKFAIKNLLPGAEIKTAIGDGNDDLPSHDLAFHMRIGVVLAYIVMVLGYRCMGSQFLQPDLVIMVQA